MTPPDETAEVIGQVMRIKFKKYIKRDIVHVALELKNGILTIRQVCFPETEVILKDGYVYPKCKCQKIVFHTNNGIVELDRVKIPKIEKWKLDEYFKN